MWLAGSSPWKNPMVDFDIMSLFDILSIIGFYAISGILGMPMPTDRMIE